MSENKLISKTKLKEFYKILVEVYNFSLSYDSKLQDKLMNLIEVYKINILERDKEELNQLKRQIYFDIKNCSDKNKKDKLYKLYQLIKNNN
ncbi:MAG: hypothetical protein LKF87_12420 [Clostridium tyrobutyricum]|jgi:hypothetical protein|uniref:hypothetical protein n=1 Tax=Clostridium tyrobutyricum TaxID=1519 RepID=UPI00242D51F8|nr:hypothetical protein [Clostridium tyrobutyricum]MCH4200163.1 hypothetical protein [Clostridium tyrobutyricum]MCH4259731.1 hypothetical protein [Clostridium tyrobutyricum]